MFPGREELRRTHFSVKLREVIISPRCAGILCRNTKPSRRTLSLIREMRGHWGLGAPSRTAYLSFLTGNVYIINISPSRIGTSNR